MAHALGLGITAWAPLAGGALSGKYLKPETAEGRVKPESIRRSERAQAIAKVVVELAEEKNCQPVQVALRWLMQKPEVTFPIVGARSAEQLEISINAASIILNSEEIAKLNAISEIELGFPHEFLTQQGVKEVLFNGYFEKIVK